MKTKKVLKISFIVILALLIILNLFVIADGSYSQLALKKMVTGERIVDGLGCEPELVDQVDGL